VKVDAVTQRWTEAFFGLARRKGVLDAIARDVERLGREVAKPAVREVLFNPRLTHVARTGAVEELARGMHPLLQNLVRLAFAKRREAVLEKLPVAFARRMLAERGAVEGVVESARPIGGPELDELARALKQRLGKDVVLRNRIDPALVGGVRVLADNRMIDCSVQGRLEGLRRRMLSARLPLATAAASSVPSARPPAD
jgi:F-type H+-transporting ATPase subunit delta